MIKDSGTILDTLPKHRQQLVILLLKNFSDDNNKVKILNIYFISRARITTFSTINFRYQCKMYTVQFRNFTHRSKLTNLKPDRASGPDLLKVNVLRNY